MDFEKCKESEIVMTEIFEAIKRSAVEISEAIMYDDTGYSEKENATGDTQLKLDIKSDIFIENEFKKITSIKEIVSEEKENKTPLHAEGKYLVGYDPLDGSSLLDVDQSVGSIFGIYEHDYSGKNLLASAYVVYGPRVELVIATDKVRMYRLNKLNEFYFYKDIKLKEKGKLNAPGSTQMCWPAKHKKMINDIFNDGYRLRYSGGMVLDLHHILLKGGGLFSYPSTSDLPKGKLRLIFEVLPFAFIFEKAGGQAIDGKDRLLNINPKHAHDTSPCFFGSNDEIKRVLKTNE